MPTLLTHITVRPDAIDRWEDVLREMVRHTHAEETGVLRYEYFRGQEPGAYYALLAFATVEDFYAHQASDYHDRHMADFEIMFADIRLEWLDAVADGGSGLPATDNSALPESADAKLAAQVALYPITLAPWWRG